MSILHLVRKSAFETSDFKLCISTLKPDDQIILLDDGCYALNHPLLSQVNVKVNVLEPHAKARSIAATTSDKFITMDKLVKLTFEHNIVVTWQ